MRALITLLMLAATTHAMAQNTTQQLSIERDSVPVTTIVPVEQTPYTSTDSIAQTAPSPEKFLSRREQRAERARLYAFSIDSLVATRSFAFYPTAMQAVPDGEIRMVYADYFYAYFSPVMVEVHLPMERGTMRQISIINFDSSEMEDFASAKFQTQWNISFSVDDRGKKYDFALVISTVTGQTELTVESPDGAMRYIGSVGQRTRER
ncbi:MAG: hypothetical protein II236_05375 [Alistipes sp.]|nr:hypothetical protein [Alistipes sp.]